MKEKLFHLEFLGEFRKVLHLEENGSMKLSWLSNISVDTESGCCVSNKLNMDQQCVPLGWWILTSCSIKSIASRLREAISPLYDSAPSRVHFWNSVKQKYQQTEMTVKVPPRCLGNGTEGSIQGLVEEYGLFSSRRNVSESLIGGRLKIGCWQTFFKEHKNNKLSGAVDTS